MKRTLLLLALPLAAHLAFAQTPSTGDSTNSSTRASGAPVTKNIEAPVPPATKGSGKARTDVKAEERASGSAGTKNIEAPKRPSTKGSGTTRAEVKAETRASGSAGTKNIETDVKK